MSNLIENLPTADRNTTHQSSEDGIRHCRQFTVSNRRCMCPRRCVMALLLSVLLVIEEARCLGIAHNLLYALDKHEKMTKYPSLENWTALDLDTFNNCVQGGRVLMSILGGLVIYHFSSHKFLFITVTVSSFLHALVPTALTHHSTAFLMIVMIIQEAFATPILVAILSILKDWAPPDEWTTLVTISFLGISMEAVSTLIIVAVSTGTFESIRFIFVGLAGIIWALLWYNIASNTPQSDPLITEEEYLYLESKIPSHYQEKSSLKDIPWKDMLKSKQVAVICLIFFTFGTSVAAMKFNGLHFLMAMTNQFDILTVFIIFVAFFIFVFIGSSFLMGYLLKNNTTKALNIRKIFLCSGFVLHSALLLVSIHFVYSYIMAFIYAIAQCCWAFSIPGILRYPLDLSPRYVSIISGVAFGFYSLGQLCFLQFSFYVPDPRRLDSKYSLSIYESVVSLIAAVVFGIWGDVEEQPWSFLRSSQRRGNVYSSNPQPENEVTLVPGIV